MERFSHKPMESWSRQKLNEARKDCLLGLGEVYGPDDISPLDFWPPE